MTNFEEWWEWHGYGFAETDIEHDIAEQFWDHQQVRIDELEAALKERDRITRHACAEAVSKNVSNDCIGSSQISRNEAHRWCMNVTDGGA